LWEVPFISYPLRPSVRRKCRQLATRERGQSGRAWNRPLFHGFDSALSTREPGRDHDCDRKNEHRTALWLICFDMNSSPLSIPLGALEKNTWCVAAIAVAMFIAGVVLSHRLEPGVRAQTVTLAEDTPALKFTPAGLGSHPVVLLAHGYTGTKENLFCYAEALAAAGFVCFSVDQPGHGISPRR
jgi:hypothetical protein